MIQLHVNHQGGYGYVSKVGMYCKFDTRLNLPIMVTLERVPRGNSRERTISRTSKVSEQQKYMGSIGSGGGGGG